MKKIKTIIISIFLFLIIPIISDFLLKKIPSIYYAIYYDCSPSFPDTHSVICTRSPWGFAIPFILGLAVAVWYFCRNSSPIRPNKKTKSSEIN